MPPEPFDVIRFAEPAPPLKRPTLIVAFEGWNDAGEAASGLVETLAGELQAQPVADIDPEEFFDFQLVRPLIRSARNGRERRIDWPHNRVTAGRLPDGRWLALLSGVEPNLRWRTFTNAVVEIARHVDAEAVVSLGALQVDFPHTKPTPLTGSIAEPEIRRRLDLPTTRYEGPTGIVGVLHQTFVSAGLPAVSLWAGVPHYLAGSVYAAAALRLGEAVTELLDADLPLQGLAVQAAEQQRDIDGVLESDEDLAAYVAELERRATLHDDADLPAATMSGDELAAEFERYLRDRRGE